MRRVLYDAASRLVTRLNGSDKVKSWGSAIANRSCHRLRRRGAQVGGDHHAVWSDGTFYVGDSAASQADTGRRANDKARKLLGAHR